MYNKTNNNSKVIVKYLEFWFLLQKPFKIGSDFVIFSLHFHKHIL